MSDAITELSCAIITLKDAPNSWGIVVGLFIACIGLIIAFIMVFFANLGAISSYKRHLKDAKKQRDKFQDIVLDREKKKKK